MSEGEHRIHVEVDVESVERALERSRLSESLKSLSDALSVNTNAVKSLSESVSALHEFVRKVQRDASRMDELRAGIERLARGISSAITALSDMSRHRLRREQPIPGRPDIVERHVEIVESRVEKPVVIEKPADASELSAPILEVVRGIERALLPIALRIAEAQSRNLSRWIESLRRIAGVTPEGIGEIAEFRRLLEKTLPQSVLRVLELGAVFEEGHGVIARILSSVRTEILRLALASIGAGERQRERIEEQVKSLQSLYLAVTYIARMLSEGVSIKEMSELAESNRRAYAYLERILGADVLRRLLEKPPEHIVTAAELPPEVFASLVKLSENIRQLSHATEEARTKMVRLGGVFGKVSSFGERIPGVFGEVESETEKLGYAFLYMTPVVGQFLATLSLVIGAVEGFRKSVSFVTGTIRNFATMFRRVASFIAPHIPREALMRIPVIGWFAERIYRFIRREGEEGKSFRARLISTLRTIITALVAGKAFKWLSDSLKGLVGGLAGAKIGAAVAGVLAGVSAKLKAGIGALAGALSSGAVATGTALVAVFAGMGKLGEALGVSADRIRHVAEVYRSQGSEIGRAGTEITATLWELGDTAKQWLSQNIPVIGGALGELAQGLVHGVALFWQGLVGIGSAFEIGARKAYDKIHELALRIAEGASHVRAVIADAWHGFASWVSEKVYSPIADAFSGIKGFVESNVLKPLSDAFAGVAGWIEASVKPVIRGVADAFTRLHEGIARLVPQDAVQSLRNTVENARNAVAGIGSTIIAGASGMLESLRRLIGGNPTGLAGAISTLEQSLRSLAVSAMDASRSMESLSELRQRRYEAYPHEPIVSAISRVGRDIVASIRELARIAQPQINIRVEAGRVVRYA